MNELTNSWTDSHCYLDARGILQSAIVEAQMSANVLKEEGINVMTTYKSKGKEFDGVIIFQNEYSSPFELKGDEDNNYLRSRKLLLVAITRAKHHVLILRQHGCKSQIFDT